MYYRTINSQKTENVMVIYVTCPLEDQGRLGRLSEELIEICAEILLAEDIRVIILTGTGGKSFSIAPNLNRENSWVDDERGREFSSNIDPIVRLDRPVIVAINGDAIGQGLELALACDIRIASEASCFGMPHIKSGLIPWDGGTQRLSRLVGKGKALEMILTGEVIDAQEALRIGLVHKVVSEKDLMEVAVTMAQEMASKGPVALRYAKEAIYKGMDVTLGQGLRLEADLYLLIHTSEDRTEGIQAFREKRTPKFKGR